MDEMASDWLHELNSLSGRKEGDGKTVAEIAEETGRGVLWVRKQLNKARQMGLLIVERVNRTRLDGRGVEVPSYRLKKKG